MSSTQFISKTDYCGLTTGRSGIVCISSDEGKSASTAEAAGQDGSIVAYNVYGEKKDPSNEYRIKADTTFSNLDLGAIVTHEGDSFRVNEYTINTSAGSAPTISASATQVEDNCTADCMYSIPEFELKRYHHAQVLFNAFTFTGDAHLQSANYTMSCNVSQATKDGVCLANDVTEGKIECSIDFIQVGSTAPVVTAGTNWAITSVLTCSNPDADWPTWSCTLTMYLAKDTPSVESESD